MAKKKCTEIGFKRGTERFGECVLRLYDGSNNLSRSHARQQDILERQRQELKKQLFEQKNRIRREQEQRIAIQQARLEAQRKLEADRRFERGNQALMEMGKFFLRGGRTD